MIIFRSINAAFVVLAYSLLSPPKTVRYTLYTSYFLYCNSNFPSGILMSSLWKMWVWVALSGKMMVLSVSASELLGYNSSGGGAVRRRVLVTCRTCWWRCQASTVRTCTWWWIALRTCRSWWSWVLPSWLRSSAVLAMPNCCTISSMQVTSCHGQIQPLTLLLVAKLLKWPENQNWLHDVSRLEKSKLLFCVVVVI